MSRPNNQEGKAAAGRRSIAWHLQAWYIRILLKLLPLLLNVFRHLSHKIRAEIDYLKPGYTFKLCVEGSNLEGSYRLNEGGTFSSLGKRNTGAKTSRQKGAENDHRKSDADDTDMSQEIDYVIAFRSLPYAFACFSGGATLKEALAQRAFSTRGPNDTGVALTYMFTALLKLFFGIRAAYRKETF